MIFQNPVLRGMYPDPSMCYANGKFYMVCSSFQYFPGVPLFESSDLINWKQIGHCLTRKSQLLLPDNDTGAGIYAPTIRFNNGRFYMVVTNVSNIGNFYVYTDDIYGQWSEPVLVEQNGIDPSLFFDDDGKVYFISNGNDADGRGFIQMSQIDISNGKKLSDNQPLWYGTGGRYIEAPHMYKFGDYYYLLNAEGGTEYGHMVNYARSKKIEGPYEPCPANPILTNRNLGGYQLQGAGHGDIVQAPDGSWWFCHLAFRQIDKYMPFHHLGRETCMEPLVWDDEGWFYIGSKNVTAQETLCKLPVANGYNQKMGYGRALLQVECPKEFDNHKFEKQNFNFTQTFENLSTKLDWAYLCNYDPSKYELNSDSFILHAGDKTIDCKKGSPTFIGIRQKEFNQEIQVNCNFSGQGQTGLTIYMDPNHHYDLYLEEIDSKFYAVNKVKIGPAQEIKAKLELKNPQAQLKIIANPYAYDFYANGEFLASADTRYLSSEVACGFCGVFIAFFAQNGACGTFTEFKSEHRE